MDEVKEVRARVYFLTPEEGGRKGPIFSGYRPPFDFGLRSQSGEKIYNDCIVTLEDRDQVFPGEESTIRIRPLHPELLQGVLRVGLHFSVTEGPRRVVGRGIITELIRTEGE